VFPLQLTNKYLNVDNFCIAVWWLVLRLSVVISMQKV